MTGPLFAKSALLGFSLAAPLGPIGAICIHRTLRRGFLAGVATGLGTALADCCYAALAAAGLAAFAASLSILSKPLALGGGIFLLWLGCGFLRPSADDRKTPGAGDTLIGTISTTFLLTIANPMTIMAFAAIFAGLGLAQMLDRESALVVVLGVLFGSMAWWISLSAAVAIARDKLPHSFAAWVSKASGVILIAFGTASVISAVPAF